MPQADRLVEHRNQQYTSHRRAVTIATAYYHIQLFPSFITSFLSNHEAPPIAVDDVMCRRIQGQRTPLDQTAYGVR